MHKNAIKNRYDFVILYDVENGNPNGDPDADNMPRVDPDTDHGIVTDVCVKRKIRNYIDIVKNGEPGYNIYIKQGTALNTQDAKGVDAIKNKDKSEKSGGFRDFMCSNFFDIRTFGAVMTTAAKDKELSNVAGQVRGPVQLAFGRSVDRITPQDIAITRVTVTTEEKGKTASTEIGHKHIVPYGLYRQEGFISANLAKTVTGFSEDDLNLFWNAVIHMFDEDRSAARGKMALRELIVFKHSNELGDAPSHKLFELVSVKRREGVLAPRAYGDYTVSVDSENLPEGVTVARKI
ncbi:MAG: type I-C CRISPR-associated protein Cas7/Csd2 [Peptococcaceae bacterium]|jgi:CRISPR-associated protein Csd2|nr:type I-C CRISPR-associated protein Cas7/Csd2 [Peptococcaceae bacterium]